MGDAHVRCSPHVLPTAGTSRTNTHIVPGVGRTNNRPNSRSVRDASAVFPASASSPHVARHGQSPPHLLVSGRLSNPLTPHHRHCSSNDPLGCISTPRAHNAGRTDERGLLDGTGQGRPILHLLDRRNPQIGRTCVVMVLLSI